MGASNHDFELILTVGRIEDLRARAGNDTALGLRAGRIVARGRRRDLLRNRTRRTRVLTMPHATVTPGVVDCHTHFLYWALLENLAIDLSMLNSLNAVLHRIYTQARRHTVDGWVLARGYDYNRWSVSPPTAAELDRVLPDVPVIARSRDGHNAWLNSTALQRCGITRNTADPKGGKYLRDADGHPTGIVQEVAVDLLPDPLRDLARRTDSDAHRLVDRALRGAYRTAWAHGITGVHSVDDGASLAHFQRQRADGRLGLRVLHAIPLSNFERAIGLGLRSGLGDEWLRIGGLKIFSDGSLGSQTAYTLEPYPGRSDYCGVPVVAGDELKNLVAKAVTHGWAVWVHAIGDRAVRESIDAIAGVRKLRGLPLPHRIEHAQCVRPADVRRLARAGIVASVQPCHILGDIETAQRHWPDTQQHAYPLRRMLDAGVTIAAGSDVPIESLDPRRGLYGAVVRADEQGRPAEGWIPKQRISVLEALRAYTHSAAAAAGLAAPVGTLEVGAPADITIWAEDPRRVPAERLLDVELLGCIVGGEPRLGDDA